METLLVQLDPDQHSAQWVVLDENDQPRATLRSGTLDQLKDFSQQRRVVCLLDSENVHIDQVVLPNARNRRKLLQAIPYTLEDELADDLETLHFALGNEQTVEKINGEEPNVIITKQIHVPVAVVAKNKISDWLQRLAAVGVKPHGLVPNLLALPLAAKQWHILIHQNQATVRTGPQSGFSCDLDNLAIMLDAALDRTDNTPQQIQIWNHNAADLELSLRHSTIELVVTKTDQAPLATLARGYHRESHINLLQGQFGFKEEYGKLFKNWVAPAALLGAWILIALLTKTTAYFQLQSENKELNSQIIEIYKQVFPQSKNFTNPRQQLKSKLDTLGTGGAHSPLLQLLNAAAGQLGAIPKARIQALEFDGEKLELELIVTEVQQLEQMRQQLQTQGLNVEIKSADTKGDQVTGDMRLSL